MADGLKFLFSDMDEQPKAMPTNSGGGLDFLFGDSNQQQERVSNEQLTYEPDRSLGFRQQAVASFSSDDEEWKRAAASYLYPNEPIDQSVKRFGQTSEGRFFHRGNDGTMYEVQPPSGLARLANTGAGVGYTIPAATGLAAGIMTAPAAATGVGTAATIGAAGAGGAFGEWVRQGLGDMMLGDAATHDMNEGAIATEGVLSSMGQGVGVGLGRALQRHAVPDIGRYSAEKASGLYDKAEKIGVRLTPAEATGLKSMIADQKRLAGRADEAGNIMGDFADERGQEVYRATQRFLNKVAPGGDAAYRGEMASKAADDIMSGLRTARTEAVDPLYKQASASAGKLDAKPIVDWVEQAMQSAKGSEMRALRTVSKFLRKSDGTTLEDSFEGLDKAKKAIDGMLRQSKMGSEAQGIDINARNALTVARGKILDLIDNQMKAQPFSASGPYLEGRSLYKYITENKIDVAKQALAPFLKANPEGASIVRLAGAVFDPRARSPVQVARARVLFKKKHPEAFRAITRDYIQDITEKALQEQASGELGNVAGRVQRAFTQGKLANIRAALEPKMYEDLTDMLDVFKAIAKSYDGNSDTAFKLAAREAADRRDMGVTARLIEYASPFDKARAARDWFATRSQRQKSEALARIIASGDRAAISRMKELRKFRENDWRRWSVFGDALIRGGLLGVDATSDALNN